MARTSHDPAPRTYQDALDEAIEETFPASDPIAPAVERANAPVSTPKNRTDWTIGDGAPAGSKVRAKAGAVARPAA